MREFHVNQSPEAHYTVYKLTSPKGKIYIGCTGLRPERRWRNGKGYTNIILKEDIEKFGWDAFTKEIVCEKLTKEGAEKIEKQLVDLLDTRNPLIGYNVRTGGSRRGSKNSAEGLAHISEGMKAAYRKDPSLRKRLSITMINKFAGDQTYSASISASCKKTRSSPEYREALSKRVKAYYARTGEKPAREAIPVMCIETGEVYSSMTKAEQATGIGHRSISSVCNGLKYSAGGLHWRFA